MQGNPQTLLSSQTMLLAASYLASVNGPTIDRQNFNDLLLHADIGNAIGAGTLTVKLQHGDASDASDMADLSPTIAFAAFAEATDTGQLRGRVKLETLKRYIRLVGTYSGNGSTEFVPACVVGVLLNPRYASAITDTYAFNAMPGYAT